jgi:hypothetical protein
MIEPNVLSILTALSIQIYEIEHDLERSTEVVGSNNPTQSISFVLVKYGIKLSLFLDGCRTKLPIAKWLEATKLVCYLLSATKIIKHLNFMLILQLQFAIIRDY